MNLNTEEMMKRQQNGKRFAGLIVVALGAVLLGKQFGLQIPEWVMSWPMFLIVIGLYIGVKHQFRKPSWIILCLIGSVFLLDNILGGISIAQYFWPAIIIVAGLFMIFSPRKKKWNNEYWQHWVDKKNEYESNGADYIDAVSIFGGIHKNIMSKDFKGGDILCIFGGSEINLSQAEIKGHSVLEIVNIFGGTKLIIPANWEIKPEMVAILGGIEDKRLQSTDIGDGQVVLVIKGTTIFGGIEIKSF